MDFQIDGVSVESVQHNGVDIDELQLDGVTVWERVTEHQWTIKRGFNNNGSDSIGFFTHVTKPTFGELQPRGIEDSIQDITTLTVLFPLAQLMELQANSGYNVEATIDVSFDVHTVKLYYLGLPAGSFLGEVDAAAASYLLANENNTIPIMMTEVPLAVVHNVYANKETGGYNRATATAAGYIWSDGTSIYYGWQESTSSGTGDVLPIPAPNVTTSVELLTGVDETLYEYALISAPFTITSRTPIDTTTSGIGTWYDIPSAGIPTLFAQCHGTENSSSDSKTSAGYLTTEWHIRLKGETETARTVQSEIKVRAKSTL